MKIRYMLVSLLLMAGCMSSPFIKFGPNSTTKVGTFHYEAKTSAGKTMEGSLDINVLTESGSTAGNIDRTGLEYLKVTGNIWEQTQVGRCPSNLVIFEGKYDIDLDNNTHYTTDVRQYSGTSWLGELFNRGLNEEENAVPTK